MNRAVLDTHILLWWRQRAFDRLSGPQRNYLERLEADGAFVISTITLWEVAKLVGGKRFELLQPLDLWLEEISHYPGLHVEPLTNRIIAASVSLENFHRDPGDELIVATALCLGLPLITSDDRIRKWGGILTV